MRNDAYRIHSVRITVYVVIFVNGLRGRMVESEANHKAMLYNHLAARFVTPSKRCCAQSELDALREQVLLSTPTCSPWVMLLVETKAQRIVDVPVRIPAVARMTPPE